VKIKLRFAIDKSRHETPSINFSFLMLRNSYRSERPKSLKVIRLLSQSKIQSRTVTPCHGLIACPWFFSKALIGPESSSGPIRSGHGFRIRGIQTGQAGATENLAFNCYKPTHFQAIRHWQKQKRQPGRLA
jgi:hypothetical protein